LHFLNFATANLFVVLVASILHGTSCSTPVNFNHFAAAEASANVCVVHGTLYNDPSVYITFCSQPDGWNVAFVFYHEITKIRDFTQGSLIDINDQKSCTFYNQLKFMLNQQ